MTAHFLTWTFVVYGLTLILTGSKLFAPVRTYLTRACSTRFPWACSFVHCPLCVGTWIGMLASLSGFSLVRPEALAWPRVLVVLADGWAAGAICFLIHVVGVRLGSEEL